MFDLDINTEMKKLVMWNQRFEDFKKVVAKDTDDKFIEEHMKLDVDIFNNAPEEKRESVLKKLKILKSEANSKSANKHE